MTWWSISSAEFTGCYGRTGFTAFITTNSIKDGDIRKDGLEQVMAQGGSINFAVRGIKWPGRANLVVSLVALHKGEWHGKRVLDGREVSVINAYFEDNMDKGDPQTLPDNIRPSLSRIYFPRRWLHANPRGGKYIDSIRSA